MLMSIASPFLSDAWIPSLAPYLSWRMVTVFIMCFITVRYFYLLHNNIKGLELQAQDQCIWGKAIKSLQEAYAHIHFMNKEEHLSDEAFMEGMISFCDTLQVFYERKTEAKCCVSIKVPIKRADLNNEDDLSCLSFVNLCRDSHHPSRDNDAYRKASHTVSRNTAYHAVISNILKDYRNNSPGKKSMGYVNNKVTQDTNYKTSSPYDNGLIPYQSEMVFPLLPIKASDKSRYVLVGFICVDCDKPDKFEESRAYEIPMMEGIGDGLYDFLYKRVESRQWLKDSDSK